LGVGNKKVTNVIGESVKQNKREFRNDILSSLKQSENRNEESKRNVNREIKKIKKILIYQINQMKILALIKIHKKMKIKKMVNL